MATVGDFLSEKSRNMRNWLRENRVSVPEGDVPPAIIVASAMELNERFKHAIEQRDWQGLANVPPAFESVVAEVRARPDLHDKFWRYLSLFIETISECDSNA